MLYAFAFILIVFWFAGMVASFTIGGLIHILPVIAIIMIVINYKRVRQAHEDIYIM